MMSFKILVVAVASFAVAYGLFGCTPPLVTSGCFRCYECTSDSDGCGDEDFKANDDWITPNCNLCSKKIIFGHVSRSCVTFVGASVLLDAGCNKLPLGPNVSRSCVSFVGASVLLDAGCNKLPGNALCHCDSDLCNSACNTRSSVAITMGMTLAVVFARRTFS